MTAKDIPYRIGRETIKPNGFCERRQWPFNGRSGTH
ncbi:hypothetical protein HCH_03673 [Hahella chejuensis KCTC 2396]|uniref:Uncharacterized protein n=1 Tax=Hahella chejuensis (strain KCTC 2396) TaxID=349521 RepID=Q2SG11_HAHCH|nr:hypothetical protein HCH_03673 [Hahella chejuensis KCTC 2396]